MLVSEILVVLQKEYPDKASVLKTMSEHEKIEYMAKIELIEYIKLLEKG